AGAFSLAAARSKPVHTMESGPAAGVTGCTSLARALGADRLISFDMGGTTAKCAIVEHGLLQTTDEYHVDGHPVRIPVIDIKEVSAGGGTIAWIDPGGALALGPQSAGADPGPVCYARGGAEPTVTDANLVLGRIDAARFLGGTMPLDLAGATRAIDEKAGARRGRQRPRGRPPASRAGAHGDDRDREARRLGGATREIRRRSPARLPVRSAGCGGAAPEPQTHGCLPARPAAPAHPRASPRWRARVRDAQDLLHGRRGPARISRLSARPPTRRRYRYRARGNRRVGHDHAHRHRR